MADMWRRSGNENPEAVAPHGHGADNVRAAIAFSFFSIFSWVIDFIPILLPHLLMGYRLYSHLTSPSSHG